MLSVVSEVAPRGVYVCGTATTVAGLTVTLVKDGDDYSLEAGALVMADRGVCCIDEFDKMQSQHHALLEAMEQQSISIAKSGVFRTLPARTSVIAAANPVGGHYDARKNVAENIRINPALLSRFDLTFLLVDRSDEETDRNIVNHILGMRLPKEGQSQNQIPCSLRNSGLNPMNLPLKEKLKFNPNEEVDLIPHILIRKYIAYARQYVYPTLSPEAAALIKDYYLRLRVSHRAVEATPVTPRQLESLLRLTQARAKLELREVATVEDAREVLEIFDFGMTGIFEDDIVVGHPVSYLTGKTGSTAPSRSQTKGTAKKLLATLQRFAIQESKNIFNMDEIKQIGRAIGIGSGYDTLVSVLNTEGFLLNKGGRVYQLQSVDF